MSVRLFIASLPYCHWVIFGHIQFWMRYVFQIFWRNSLDICLIITNKFRFLLCLSVCSLAHFLTELILTLFMSTSRWVIFFKSSEDLFKVCVHRLQIISDFFYVCQSVYCFISFEIRLSVIYLVLDKLSFSFWRYSCNVCKLAQYNLRILVCFSVCLLLHFLTDIRVSVISPVMDEKLF